MYAFCKINETWKNKKRIFHKLNQNSKMFIQFLDT